MLITTWNLNHRVGKTTFRPEAAEAAVALNSDVLVFTEFFAQKHETDFRAHLSSSGWPFQEISEATQEKANRVLVASKLRLRRLDLPAPSFDQQFASNLLTVVIHEKDLPIIGVRIPWYPSGSLPLRNSWNWLEAAARALSTKPAIILGDLNVHLASPRSRGGEHFRRILRSGWHRAPAIGSGSYFNSQGKASEIDHILGTVRCHFAESRYVTECGGFTLAGSRTSISDHCALVTEVEINADTPRL